VVTKNAAKTLSLKLTIKNIVQMNVAVLLLTVESWKSIMKRRLSGMAHSAHAKSAEHSLADIINLQFAYLVKRS
jgi:hypothetical protein